MVRHVMSIRLLNPLKLKPSDYFQVYMKILNKYFQCLRPLNIIIQYKQITQCSSSSVPTINNTAKQKN